MVVTDPSGETHDAGEGFQCPIPESPVSQTLEEAFMKMTLKGLALGIPSAGILPIYGCGGCIANTLGATIYWLISGVRELRFMVAVPVV
jgi:hypothetical protein